MRRNVMLFVVVSLVILVGVSLWKSRHCDRDRGPATATEGSPPDQTTLGGSRESRTELRPDELSLKNEDGRWMVVQVDGTCVIDFGRSESNAQKALQVIQHYGMNSIHRIGDSFMYLLVDGQSPQGALPGKEDAIRFDPKNTAVTKIGGRWKIVEGTRRLMFDFKTDEQAARDAHAVIVRHGFTHSCFVGRPHPPMSYLRK